MPIAIVMAVTMVQCNGYENSNSNGIGNDYYKNLDNIA